MNRINLIGEEKGLRNEDYCCAKCGQPEADDGVEDPKRIHFDSTSLIRLKPEKINDFLGILSNHHFSLEN